MLEFDFSDVLGDLRAEAQVLKQNEEQILNKIENELTKMERKLGNSNFTRVVDQASARLDSDLEIIETDSRQLANSLNLVSGLAENISSRVAALDLAKGRVVECLQRISDLRDLRTCAEGVEEAIRQEEYDDAARHIHRFFTLDSVVFKMGDQIDAKDAGHSLKNSYEVLRQAAANLKVIIENKFDEARQTNDVASMERYFKLFPLINEHSTGLQRFGSYLCEKIEKLGEENFKIMQAGGTDDKRKNVIFADTLTLIVEGIARIIELHQALVDTFYGPDKFLHLLEIIQGECDRQTIRVVNAFIQRRQFEVKARQVENFVRNPSSESRTEKVDALELDVLLSEVTLMHTRAELYWRFLKRRLQKAPARALSESISSLNLKDGNMNKPEEVEVLEEEELSSEERKEMQERIRRQRVERDQKLDAVLNRTALNMKMQELLGKYVLMEQYYMTESVKKAIEMDTVEEDSLTSSLLDDVFFIVRKSIRRSISSSSIDCICAMLNNGITLLETDFLKYINAPIKAGYSSVGWTTDAYQTAQNAYAAISVQHGKTASELSSEKQKSAFLIALNNLRSSVECVNSLKNGLADDLRKHLIQISSVEKTKLENAMGQFDELCKRLEHHANLGIGKLCEAAFRPTLKVNAEVMLDIPHILNDDQLAEFESVDPFVENFISLLDKQLAHFEGLLVPENYQALLGTVSGETVHQLERVILKCNFNRLGGLQLDKEYRQVTSYLTSIAGWSVREKCARLSQVVALLNAENFIEATEFFQQLQTSILSTGTLSLNELKRILALRSDFPREKIKALKI